MTATVAFSIVPYSEAHGTECAAILRALPDWFGIPESNERYLKDLSALPAFVAVHGTSVIAFASVRRHGPRAAEVEVLAVRPEMHRQGVGGALLAHCEQWLADEGAHWLHVKTLGPSHPDAYYARTRAFYEALGFEPLFETNKFWGESNPTLVLVKHLG